MHYVDYRHLAFHRHPHGVLVVELARPDVHNAVDARLLHELAAVWGTIREDAEVRVAIVTGQGTSFCAGADPDLLEANAGDGVGPLGGAHTAALTANLVALDKPVIAAIDGVAMGVGLILALLADISVATPDARLADGHTRVGVAPGDLVADLWALRCGPAKAAYYLLTSASLSGTEAERIGLVSQCVERERLMRKALQIATRLALGPQGALRRTRRSLWRSLAPPDAAAESEDLLQLGDDAREGARAVRERREPRFPSSAR